jgi:hypothetical protein
MLTKRLFFSNPLNLVLHVLLIAPSSHHIHPEDHRKCPSHHNPPPENSSYVERLPQQQVNDARQRTLSEDV